MKYSIIISYRNREEHLSTLLPRLKDLFKEESYEIIIAEQDDNDVFQKNSLYNLAALKSLGDILVFHDVDYYPSDTVSYYTDENTPLYPVKQVLFLNSNGELRDKNNIPLGYANFHNNVGDHSGGVFVMHRSLFFNTNGLNPYYKGWGKEDDDTRDRLRLLGYNWKRNNGGLFYALYHEDNKPEDNDVNFINNSILLYNLKNTLDWGYNDVTADVETYVSEDNIKWLKIKNFKYNEKNILNENNL
jgi:hypothetical protein